jgi:hypothetical protein
MTGRLSLGSREPPTPQLPLTLDQSNQLKITSEYAPNSGSGLPGLAGLA